MLSTSTSPKEAKERSLYPPGWCCQDLQSWYSDPSHSNTQNFCCKMVPLFALSPKVRWKGLGGCFVAPNVAMVTFSGMCFCDDLGWELLEGQGWEMSLNQPNLVLAFINLLNVLVFPVSTCQEGICPRGRSRNPSETAIQGVWEV